MSGRGYFLIWLVGCAGCGAVAAGELVVESGFPGGSAEVMEIDQERRVVRLRPTAHGDRDRGWACWWYCEVTGITPGERIAFEVGDAPWATPDRAVWSVDRKHWEQTGAGRREGKRITYTVAPGAGRIWVAWGVPFLLGDAVALVEGAAKLPAAEAYTLCTTREGHKVPALRVGERGGEGKLGIWVQARQHAWESGSSWVAKGFVDWLVSEEDAAAELRAKSVVHVVPIMDVDNVERGAGGKGQKPQDHNRDWTGAPHWESVRAAQRAILEMDKAGGFDLFLDLHNPAAGDREPFYFLPPKELVKGVGKGNYAAFLAASKEAITGPLAFRGLVRESGSAYDAKAWFAISKNWVAAHCREHVVSVTLETSWNEPASTVAGYEQVGRELGRAVAAYFTEDRRGDAREGK